MHVAVGEALPAAKLVADFLRQRVGSAENVSGMINSPAQTRTALGCPSAAVPLGGSQMALPLIAIRIAL